MSSNGCCPGAPKSIYQVAREIKKHDASLFNCLNSIKDDAAFVSEIRVLYPDLPLLANLRCGLWYAPRPDGTCCFKSTDGHCGHHQFSCTRLNWHVAELAARKGGCVIVDATRRGKRFPDAMSKTIPIWATVINRAVARVRAHDAQKELRRRSYSTHDGQVLAAVADTQDSISVRDCDGDASAAAGTAAAASSEHSAGAVPQQQQQQLMVQQQVKEHVQQQQQQVLEQQRHDQLDTRQQQQQQQCACRVVPEINCSVGLRSIPVEEMLVDQMAPSMALLSAGLKVAVPTSDLGGPAVLRAQPSTSTEAGLPSSLLLPAASMPLGSPHDSSRGHHRWLSLQLSPQPSLHEWLGVDDMRYYHSMLSMTDVECRMTHRRSQRVSCHTSSTDDPEWVGGLRGGSWHSHGNRAPESMLYASSAPAVSCLLNGSPQALSSSCIKPLTNHCSLHQHQLPPHCAERGVAEEPPPLGSPPPAAAGLFVGHQADLGRGDGVTLVSAAAVHPAAPAAEPVTPRIGGIGGLTSAAPLVESAHRQQQAAAGVFSTSTSNKAAAPSCSLTVQQLQQLDEWHAQGCPGPGAGTGGPPTVGSAVSVAAAGDVAVEFAFPAPEDILIAQSASSSQAVLADGSVLASLPPDSATSSCGCGSTGLPVPEMPVVVLNGTSHQPGDAASILDIWRGTDLEELASLPRIGDFLPGVYHLPPQQQQQQQQQQLQTDGEEAGDTFMDQEDDWLLVQQEDQHMLQRRPADCFCEPLGGGSEQRGTEKGCAAWQDCNGWVQLAAAETGSADLSPALSLGNCRNKYDDGLLSPPRCASAASTWLNEELCIGYSGLCAFAVPAALPAAAQLGAPGAGDDDASMRSSSSNGGQSSGGGHQAVSPGSLGAGSDCSSCDSVIHSAAHQCGERVLPGGAGDDAAPAGPRLSSVPASPAAAVEWDTALHLPLWVSANEAQAIETKIDGWVERLLEVGADVRGLAALLRKPLRPLWLCQDSLIWTNQVAHPSSLPFTPLLLVSASQPHQYERQAGRASWQQAMRHSSCRASTSSWLLRGAGLLSSTPTPDGCIDCDQADDSAGLLVGDVDNDDDDVDDDEGSPPSAGSISSWAGGFRQHHSPGRASGRSKATVGRSRLGKASAVSSWSYVYVPGAGDDEESWAGGLTPALFWANCGLLLGSGPMGVEGAALQLVQQHRSWPFGTSAASSTNSTLQLMVGEQQQQQYADGQLSVSSSGNVKQFLVGKHHPAPQGCVSDRAVGTGGTRVVRAAPGAFWLGSTGLAIGNLHESTASDVWRAVDAVLCCGTGLAPALLQEYQAMQVVATRPAAMLVAPRSAGCDGTAATDNQPELICSRSAPGVMPGLSCGLELAAESGGEGLVACAAASASSSLHASFWCGQLQGAASQRKGTGVVALPGSAVADGAQQEQEQQQQQEQLDLDKVPLPPVQPAKPKPRKRGSMLTALLSQAGKAGGHLAAGSTAQAAAAAAAPIVSSSAGCWSHTRSNSADSNSSNNSCASVGSTSSITSASSAVTADSNGSSYYSTCSDDVAQRAAASSPVVAVEAAQAGRLPRLKWLPIEPAKKDRSSLKHHLQEALEFVSAHLAAGHLVLLHDVEGHDHCVSVAVATLLACFTPAEALGQAGSGSSGAEPRFVAPWPSTERQQAPCSIPATKQQQQQLHVGLHMLSQQQSAVQGQQQQQQQQQQPPPPSPGSGGCARLPPELPPETVSKQCLRQRLALVSSCYPPARPTRATLKQVYNFFEERRRDHQAAVSK